MKLRSSSLLSVVLASGTVAVRITRRSGIRLLLAASAVALSTQAAMAAPDPYVWNNSTSANFNWNDASKWTPGAPAVGGNANMTLSFQSTQHTITTNNIGLFDVNQLTLNGGSNKNLTVAGASSNSVNFALTFVESTDNVLPSITFNRTSSGTTAVTLAINVKDALTISNTVTTAGVSTPQVTGAIANAGGITVSGPGNISLTGAISGLGAITYNSNGTVALGTANSSYTGSTKISSGTVTFGRLADAGTNSALGASSVANLASDLVLDGGTLKYTGTTTASSNRNYTLTTRGGTLDASGATANTSVTFSGSMTATGATGSQTLTLTGTGTGAAGTAGILSGTVSNGTGSNTTALSKTGAGTWTLSAANTHSGGTAVTAGTLVVANTTGSATGSGLLSVGAGAALAGTGTSSGSAFNIAGTGPTPGTQASVLVGQTSATDTNTSNDLTLLGAGASTVDNANLLFNLSVTAPGQANNLLVGNTGISFTNSLLTLNMIGAGTVADNTTYLLIDGTDVSQYSNLSTFTNGLGQLQITGGLSLAFGDVSSQNLYTSSYLFVTPGGDISVAVAAVPEPGTWVMLVGGLAMLLVARRAGRKSAV